MTERYGVDVSDGWGPDDREPVDRPSHGEYEDDEDEEVTD